LARSAIACPSCSAEFAIFYTRSVTPTGFCGCSLHASFFTDYCLMQVLYASPPRQASTATFFSNFWPAHARASLQLFSLFVFSFPCFAFVSYPFFVLLFLLFCICFVFACYFLVVFGFLFDFSATLLISFASVSLSSVHCRAFSRAPTAMSF
jgi:hypothetical protein